MHKSEVRSIGIDADYGDFRIVEGALSLDEAKALLSNVVEKDRLCFPDMPEIDIQASLYPNSSKQFQHSGPSRFPTSLFPYYEFSFSVDQDFKGDSTQGVLHSVALPVFPSAAAAIESYLSTRLGDNSQYSGVLAALVPDYRGRIKEIHIGTNSVQVEIECLAGSSENDLIGKVYVRYYAGISITADLNFTDNKASAEIRDFPRDLLVVAIGATALANRRGGRMFIGVADDCSIFGCKLEKPKDTLTQILRAYCDPPLNVVIDEVQIRNLPVIVVTIPEGKDKPYTVKEKGVYIRTGSNKRPITRYELDEIYSAKQGIRSLYL